MKQAKIMISKFNGVCNICRSAVNAGDSIKWISKGVVECMACADTAAPVTVDSVSDKWAAAMSWDDEAPAPGASIQSDNVESISAQIPARVAAPVIAGPGPDDSPKSFKQVVTPALVDAPAPKPALVVVDTDSTARKANPVAAPVGDPMTALLSDQLVTLVNAIDNATTDQRHALKAFAQQLARSSDRASRARIWDAVAHTVIA